MPHFLIIPRSRHANALILSLIFISVISFLVVITFERTDSNTRSTSRRINGQEAVRIAEAGIEKAVWCLNSGSCAGGSNYVGETDTVLGQGSFTSSLTTIGTIAKQIDVYATIGGSGGTVTKHLRANIKTTDTSASFNYGMQAGTGGIMMDQNDNKIYGSVYANGSVYGSGNGNEITGDVILAPSGLTSAAAADPAATTNTPFGRNTIQYVVQSFIPNSSDNIVNIRLKIARTAESPSDMVLYIYSDNNNTPGSSLGNISVIASTFPSGTPDWRTIPFNLTNPLASGVKYWIVMRLSSGNPNRYYWVAHTTATDPYIEGHARYGNSPTVGLNDLGCSTCDIPFEIQVGGINPTLNVQHVGGKAIAYRIENTIVDQHACYKETISSTAHGESCTETSASDGAIPCAADNTQDDAPSNGNYCHYNNPNPLQAEFPLSPDMITQIEERAAEGGTVICPTTSTGCTLSGTIGPKKYIGNITISEPSTLAGTVWAQGNIILSSTLTLSAIYGSNSGVVIADNIADPNNIASGRIDVESGDLLGYTYHPGLPDETKTYIMAIAMSKSMSSEETTAAWSVKNHLTAAIVYAANGSVYIKNKASLNAITAQKVYMKGLTELTYNIGLANALFSSGPGASWIYQPSSYQVVN